MPVKNPIGKPAPKVAGTSRTLPKPGPAPAEDEQEEQQPTMSKEDAFDSAEPESGFGIPNGNYIVHLVKCVVDKSKAPKETVQFHYEVAEGDQEGKTVVSFYNLYDAKGEQMRGIGFLKRDCEMLGQPAFRYAELEEAMQTLEAERLQCNISVKQNGQWTNVFLQGLAED